MSNKYLEKLAEEGLVNNPYFQTALGTGAVGAGVGGVIGAVRSQLIDKMVYADPYIRQNPGDLVRVQPSILTRITEMIDTPVVKPAIKNTGKAALLGGAVGALAAYPVKKLWDSEVAREKAVLDRLVAEGVIPRGNKYLPKLASLSEVVTPDEAINAMQYSADPRLRRAYMDIDTYRRNPATRYSVSGSLTGDGAHFSVDPELTPFEEHGYWYEGLPHSREDAQRKMALSAEKANVSYAGRGLGIGAGVGALLGTALAPKHSWKAVGKHALFAGGLGGLVGAIGGAGRDKYYRDENTRALLYLKALELRDRNRA